MNTDSPLRYEARLKVTGRATYAAEAPFPDMLHAALVESNVSRGRVLEVDAAKATERAGVVDVVSYREAEWLKSGPGTALIREPIVHFRGQPVALCIGETVAEARAGASLVRVAYVEEPAVSALGQALDQAYIPAMASRFPAESSRGDSAAGLDGAKLIIAERYETAVNNHHPLEPHAVVCAWDGDQLLVHCSTQAIFGARAAVASAFHMPPDHIRVIAEHLGGGFGCKGVQFYPWMLLAVLAAKRAGRPVRLELTRAQLFTLVGRRSETIQDLRLGFDETGRMVAAEHDVLAQTSTFGEYADTTAGASRWLYGCPNVSTRHRLVRTNEPQPIPMRAPGSAPGSFALESAMDEAARALNIDPLDLRRRNISLQDEENARPWTSDGLLDCYRVGAERFGWRQRPASGTEHEGRWRVGSGMAATYYPQHWQGSQVMLTLERAASLRVECGTQDMGSGTPTVLAQLAASELGIPMCHVSVNIGDTRLPRGPISAGSQVTLSIAPAIKAATDQLKADLSRLAYGDVDSPLAGVPPEEIVFDYQTLSHTGGNASESLADLFARNSLSRLQAVGTSPAPEAPLSALGRGAVFVEVGVDPKLGEVRVRRVCGAFAAGRIVNPLLAKSQYVGGLVGGIGMALHEETVTDRPSGRILGDNFADYLIPVHADMPTFDIAFIHEDDPHLPGGIKGVGMLGAAGVQAAIANAIYDAINVRVRRLPIRILSA